MLKIIFLFFSTLLFLALLVYKLFIQRKKRSEKTSVYVSAMGGILLLYVLFGLIIGLIKLNPVFLLFSLSPFIIGKFATYKKEDFYSYLQIIIIASGIFYTIII